MTVGFGDSSYSLTHKKSKNDANPGIRGKLRLFCEIANELPAAGCRFSGRALRWAVKRLKNSGDEFLNTQSGNNNPYNQDNELNWLNWKQLEGNHDIFSFFKKMIAFRKSHPSLCRSRFWRDDISWYGTGPAVDLSLDSHSLAFCLHGASQADDDIYVMINAYWQELQFQIHEGAPDDWLRIVDTALPAGEDFCEAGVALEQAIYQVAPRSIVALVRRRDGV